MEVTPADFKLLREACDALENAHVPYVIGGGTAVVLHGRDRRTKDFDVYLNPEMTPVALDALSRAGFTSWDTDKNWLYKATRGELIIDLIVESRGSDRITPEVIHRSHIVEMYGYDFRVMGPEDTVYRKALTLTEGRPDWHDAMSIIRRQGENLDWTYLLSCSRRHPRRMLAFLLFAQTEMHAPPGIANTPRNNNLYAGDLPGLIPEWVVFSLVRQIWLSAQRPSFGEELKSLPKAA